MSARGKMRAIMSLRGRRIGATKLSSLRVRRRSREQILNDMGNICQEKIPRQCGCSKSDAERAG